MFLWSVEQEQAELELYGHSVVLDQYALGQAFTTNNYVHLPNAWA